MKGLKCFHSTRVSVVTRLAEAGVKRAAGDGVWGMLRRRFTGSIRK